MGRPLRVLVFLPRALDVEAWADRFARGEVPDATPYGYHFAREFGCELSFASPTPTWRGVAGLFDKAVKRVLGFDLRHVWSQRHLLDVQRFDAVWTHTEYEHLAIGLVRKLQARVCPPVIAQSIWLIDEWPRWSALRRWAYRRLMSGAEVATFHSPLNETEARRQGLAQSVAIVEFGISLDSYPLVRRELPVTLDDSRPIRVLALGNDRHRDWATLSQALGGNPRYELHIGSTSVAPALVKSNMTVGPMTQAQIVAEYAWADCVVVPLRFNQHVSGLTATLEGVAMGVPVVAARAGGLDHYFDDHALGYYRIGDADNLRQAVDALANEPGLARRRADAAQQRLTERQFTSRGFAWRHVQLSHRLHHAALPAGEGNAVCNPA
jgi:glycosyltransferase involved in cell wall biosynthesis